MNDDKLEGALRRLRPRRAAERLRARILNAEPVLTAAPEIARPAWWRLLPRLAFAGIAVTVALFFVLPERSPVEQRPASLPSSPARNATMATVVGGLPATFTPLETNRVILSSQPIGTITGPDETPLELRRVRWLDFSRSQSPTGDQLVIGYENEQIIPVALTIH